MIHVGHFLTSHPLGLLAVTVLLEQAGIPIAGAPLLLLIGALTGSESVNLPLAVLVAVSASVFVDCAWFDFGRSRKSNPVGAFKHLQALDASSFRIGHLFTRRAGLALFVTRFIPGPNLAAAVAGLSGFSRLRFVVLDIIVSGLWAFLYLAAGRFLPRELRSWLSSTMSASPGRGIFLVLGFAVVILVVPRFWHYLSRGRTSRPEAPLPSASDVFSSDTYPNPEVVGTGEVQ